MSILDFFNAHTLVFLAFLGVFGLIIGSFLNVVIHRLPIMLQANWFSDCSEFLKEQHQIEIKSLLKSDMTPFPKPYNLIVPNSHCPKCHHAITALENIPIISYLFLRGRCRACKSPISLRYPFVELLTAIVTLLTITHFGLTLEGIFALLLSFSLIALSFIDIDHKILPDDMTLSLLWVGLGLNIFGLYTDASSAIIGAMVGYMSLWSLFWIFKLLTGKEGMGYGDFKLLAVLGAWLGWQKLPLILLLSSMVGTIIGLTLIFCKKQDRATPIPFGPYLAIAGWIALIWGDKLTEWYLNWSGLS